MLDCSIVLQFQPSGTKIAVLTFSFSRAVLSRLCLCQHVPLSTRCDRAQYLHVTTCGKHSQNDLDFPEGPLLHVSLPFIPCTASAYSS